jgi:hypothetical protein
MLLGRGVVDESSESKSLAHAWLLNHADVQHAEVGGVELAVINLRIEALDEAR